jgi:hypothetical protein
MAESEGTSESRNTKRNRKKRLKRKNKKVSTDDSEEETEEADFDVESTSLFPVDLKTTPNSTADFDVPEEERGNDDELVYLLSDRKVYGINYFACLCLSFTEGL